MVAEQLAGANIVGQKLERLVAADLAHFEDAGTLTCRFRQEPGAERIATELSRVEPGRRGSSLHDPRDAPVRHRLCRQPSARRQFAKHRSRVIPSERDPGKQQALGLQTAAFGNGNHRACTFLIGFRTTDRQPQPLGNECDVGQLQCNELGPA
jgi:hypothetical protein